jgi:uncharacterized protein (DUF1800 family)
MAQTWASPDGLVKRMQWSQGFAAVVADRSIPTPSPSRRWARA